MIAGRSGAKGPLLDSRRTSREGHPIDLTAAVQPYLGPVVVALTVAVLLLVLLDLVLVRRLAGLRRRLENLTRGSDERSLEAVLEAHIDKVFAVSRELDELAARSAVMEAAGRRAFQRVGLVRYNPYEDTGGNQSFALAMLDAEGDGVLLNSLHTRNGTRIYAKTLNAGRADAALSTEEAEALRQATESSPSTGRPARAGA